MIKIPTLLFHRIAIRVGVPVEAANGAVLSGDSAEVVIDESHRGVIEMKSKAVEVGLGDAVAMLFSSVGVTKNRAQTVAKAFGFDDCGCQGRQDAINDAGRKWFGIG